MQVLMLWKKWAQTVTGDVLAIFLAVQDKRVPWYTKAVALAVVGYAFSPIDLVPDFIPILGYIDDLVILPMGIKLVIRLIPQPILQEYRERARTLKSSVVRKSWIAAGVILSIWVIIFIALFFAFKN